MQLVDVGRNDPCPCGSGRKHKKCCLGARAEALTGNGTGIDAAALVDQAIDSDEWGAIRDLVDRAMDVFDIGGPLEHVRFRDDLIEVHDPDHAELSRLCSPGWLARCELEIAQVLARFVLEPEIRDALRMGAYLIRRFGAKSPLVEELARLQVGECVARDDRFANAMSVRGLRPSDVNPNWIDTAAWLERLRPPILSFAEWFALRAAPEDFVETVWKSGLARTIFETCIDRVEDAPSEDVPWWAALGGMVSTGEVVAIGRYLARETPLREPTTDEQTIYDSLHHGREEGRDGHVVSRGRDGILHDVLRATEDRSDFAGAALLRETMRIVQHERR